MWDTWIYFTHLVVTMPVLWVSWLIWFTLPYILHVDGWGCVLGYLDEWVLITQYNFMQWKLWHRIVLWRSELVHVWVFNPSLLKIATLICTTVFLLGFDILILCFNSSMGLMIKTIWVCLYCIQQFVRRFGRWFGIILWIMWNGLLSRHSDRG